MNFLAYHLQHSVETHHMKSEKSVPPSLLQSYGGTSKIALQGNKPYGSNSRRPANMFEKLSTDETRTKCREALDALEFWLRRIIDQILFKNYGLDYFFYKNSNGDFLINSGIRKNIQEKMGKEPDRYNTPISAIVFTELINIICNPDLYKKHFKDIFFSFFPGGVAELRIFLARLIEPRNYLAHSNPISTRQAEQVICYSHDIIDSIKNFYKSENMQEEYNVPTIFQIKDSFGNIIEHKQFSFFKSFSLKDDPKSVLRSGDLFSLEVEVDPSFQENEYSIEWRIAGFPTVKGKRFDLKIENKHVTKQLTIECRVISNKDWHALSYCDDKLDIYYKVLPPI